jgi:hypothetical protein
MLLEVPTIKWFKVKIMINFPKGVTSWLMMARIEWNYVQHILVESETCNLIMLLNYVHNIISLM